MLIKAIVIIYGETGVVEFRKTCYGEVANLSQTCYGLVVYVANLLRTCYEFNVRNFLDSTCRRSGGRKSSSGVSGRGSGDKGDKVPQIVGGLLCNKSRICDIKYILMLMLFFA